MQTLLIFFWGTWVYCDINQKDFFEKGNEDAFCNIFHDNFHRRFHGVGTAIRRTGRNLPLGGR
jgi:hypothetical protein